jgi:hypothetical protein
MISVSAKEVEFEVGLEKENATNFRRKTLAHVFRLVYKISLPTWLYCRRRNKGGRRMSPKKAKIEKRKKKLDPPRKVEKRALPARDPDFVRRKK